MKTKKRSIASLRRDIYHAISAILQGDLDNGSDWISQERDGTDSIDSVIVQREAVVKKMRDEFARKSRVR
jgi:hypothetical protein